MLVYEVYRDTIALSEHQDSDAVAEAFPLLGDLLAGPPEITYAEPRSSDPRSGSS